MSEPVSQPAQLIKIQTMADNATRYTIDAQEGSPILTAQMMAFYQDGGYGTFVWIPSDEEDWGEK